MEWIAAAVIIAALFAKGFGTGNKELPGSDPNKPGRDVPPKPGADDDPKKPGGSDPKKPVPPTDPNKPTLPKSIKTWGDPKALPSWFKPNGNSFWISPGCDQIAEGPQFLPLYTADTSAVEYAIEEPTLFETLATPTGSATKENSAYGFVDYLMSVEGLVDPEIIAFRFVQEAAPICADVPPGNWPMPLQAWHRDFALRITRWVNEWTGGIDFGEE